MVFFPPCKINLGLHVVQKRPDGFHELETCFYPVPWTDALELITAEQFSFTSSGAVIHGSADDNLCVRAFQLLQKDFDLKPIKIHLHKIIPMGAGLGGGSSDAAYVLRMLNTMFSLDLTQVQLMQYAALLGSDCAFFIQDAPMLGTGRGEILQPTTLSLKGKYLLVINAGIHVSTAEAFGGIKPTVPEKSIDTILSQDISTWCEMLKNDFEETVFKKHPRIAEMKMTLYENGAIYASMSGSGSSVYGIFHTQPNWNDQSNNTSSWSGKL